MCKFKYEHPTAQTAEMREIRGRVQDAGSRSDHVPREQTQQEVKARTEKSVLRNDDWSAVPESYTQEELYGDEPCDAVASGDTSTPAVSGDARSSTDATGKPLVPPPEFGERIRDTDKEAGWIPGAFPTLLQNET